MINVNEYGGVTIESADKSMRFIVGLYCTWITIGKLWFFIGRDDVYKDDWDEMFFFHLHYKGKELVKIYAYLPRVIHVSILERNLCN
jgi:hypothetical protein